MKKVEKHPKKAQKILKISKKRNYERPYSGKKEYLNSEKRKNFEKYSKKCLKFTQKVPY